MIALDRTVELPVPPEAAWAALWDVARIARCLPGCQEVEEVEPRRRYRATVRDRVGPFAVTIPLEVGVEASEAGHELRLSVTGRDAVLGSPVRLTLTARLQPAAAGSALTLDGQAEVGGKLAALGQGVIHRKTRDLLDAFARNLGQLFRGPA